jgi:hypothetical protein
MVISPDDNNIAKKRTIQQIISICKPYDNCATDDSTTLDDNIVR